MRRRKFRLGKRAAIGIVMVVIAFQCQLFRALLKYEHEIDALIFSVESYTNEDEINRCKPPDIPNNDTLSNILARADNNTSSPKLYLCGWISPESTSVQYLRLLFPNHSYIPLTPQTGPPYSSQPFDILMTSEHVEPACQGVWQGNDENVAFERWIVNEFQGKVLYRNGESRHLWNGPETDNVYHIGYYKDSPSEHTMRFRPIQMTLLEYGPEWWIKLLDHRHKPVNTRERFAVYAATNCDVPFREDAANRLANISVVDLGGPCNGGGRNVEKRFRPAPQDLFQDTNWDGNRERFSIYRFCLVLENTYQDGYVTEKILNAFLAGCVPVWYGSREIFDIFNKNAFIYYDINSPELALARVRELESNKFAYDEIMKQPILANCQATIEEYFSFTSKLGGGMLIQKLHRFMRLISEE